jgi:DNA ligase (NAD+)
LLCPAQASGRIKNWVNHLNLLDFGVGLIDKLIESGRVKTVADLYRLKENDISTIDRMGVRSAKKVIDVLNNNKRISLEKFLGSLSIPMIGERMFTHVVEAGYDTLDKIFALSAAQLAGINKMGAIKANKAFDGLCKNKALIDELLSLGITIKSKEGCLKGKSFCFTGTMKQGRKSLVQMVEDNGGTIKSGASLNYLVINDPNFTSAKVVAAKKYGTKCISEDEFLAMVTSNRE